MKALRFTKEQKKEYFAIMRKGNIALKQCADALDMEYKQFRIKLFKNPLKREDWQNDVYFELIKSSLPAIQEVRKIENIMLCGFQGLVVRLAKKWSKWNDGILSYEDYYQEGLMALLDAIYGYTREEIAFITYAYWTVQNRMSLSSNKLRQLSPLTNEALGLLKRFDTTKIKANRYVTDDEVFEMMELTPKEAAVIRDAKVTVCSPNTLDDDGKEDRLSDYTDLRRGIANEKDTVPLQLESKKAMCALEKAKLSDFERLVIETHMKPYYGWKQKVAAESFNPHTSKPYSKAAINVVLNRALRKIKSVYSKMDMVA